MMMKSKTLTNILLLGIVSTSLTGCFQQGEQATNPTPTITASNPATAKTKVSVRLPIPAADAIFSPYYLAIDKGFFAKQGLDVKLEPGTPELPPIKMVAQGANEIGVIGGPELLLNARAKKVPVVGISLLHRNSNFVTILSLKKNNLTKLKDLNGKKVGFFYGHISTDVIRMALAKENIKVQETDVGFDYGQMLNGKLDAQWAFRTTAGIALPAKGVELNSISPADAGIVTQGHMVITNESMIKDKPQVVQAFINAYLEGLKYSVEHPDEAIAATIKRDPNFKRAVGEKQLAIINPTIKANTVLGAIPAEAIDRTQKQMQAAKLLPAGFDPKSAYTTQFVDKYYSQSPKNAIVPLKTPAASPKPVGAGR
jgi:NitT/TauT family transport system substrate-binding protein